MVSLHICICSLQPILSQCPLLLLGFDRSCLSVWRQWQCGGLPADLISGQYVLCCPAMLNRAAGSPIAQLSDSPPDGGSARSLSGLLPRPGNSGKLSRHETTLGGGEGWLKRPKDLTGKWPIQFIFPKEKGRELQYLQTKVSWDWVLRNVGSFS